MKIQVVLQAEGKLGVVAGQAEADSWSGMKAELPACLRALASALEAVDIEGITCDALDDDEA